MHFDSILPNGLWLFNTILRGLFFFIIVISYLTHTLIYETFLISKVLAKHSLISHRAGKKTLQWCWEAHILGTCGECLCGFMHTCVPALVSLGLLLSVLAIFSGGTAPKPREISCFCRKELPPRPPQLPTLSLGWGDTRIKKKEGIFIHVSRFLKIRLFTFRSIESIHCFFFPYCLRKFNKSEFPYTREKHVLVVSTSSSQRANTRHLDPPCRSVAFTSEVCCVFCSFFFRNTV